MIAISARAIAVLLGTWREDATAAAYLVLADRIRIFILDGRIPLGTRIPAERDLAGQLGVSRTTVTAAYAELRDGGYLASTRGSGSVATLPRSSTGSSEQSQPGMLDFSKATLPAYSGVMAAAAAAAAELPTQLGGSGFDPVGLPELREAIAARYAARGLPTDASQVMVTLGAQHAIALVARTLLARGDRVIVEAPSYPHALEALRNAGGRLVAVNVSTENGWDEAGFEQAFQRTSPTLAYLMPDFQNPTGQTMPGALRSSVARLAAAQGTTLVIDETIGELAIDRIAPHAPFAPEGAILVGSVGKTIWGGLRIGWIRAERPVVQRLVRARDSGDLGTPILEQLIVTRLLRDYDTILEVRREQLRKGRDDLAQSLAMRIPEWRVPAVAGGLVTWVNIGAPVSSQLALAARTEGLVITSGSRFGIDGAFERFLRIPFSYPEADLERAVDALVRAWAAVARYAPQDSAELATVL